MKLLKIFLSRMFLFGFLILMQVYWIYLVTSKVINHYQWIKVILMVLSIIVVLWLINKDENPSYKLAWIMLILIFPGLGGLLYFFIGNKKPSRRLRKKLEVCEKEIVPYMSLENEKTLEIEDSLQWGLQYLSTLGYGTYQQTQTKYYSLGDYNYIDLLRDIKNAKHYIFMEYFIVSKGMMFDTLLDMLEQKVKEGVDVRFIYDDVGSLTTVPYHFEKKLEERGIKCVVFNPFIPIMSVAINHRDHRKICVIDGFIGYSGGFNLADEYINAKERFGHWKDAGIRLEGDAVWNLTLMFLSIWNAYRPTDKDYLKYRPDVYQKDFVDDGFVCAYGDSPLDNERTGENIYLNMIAQAKKEILIMTPYFIIDDTMNKALVLARRKGVKVKIITPGVPDKKTVYKVTRSFYLGLIEEGIEVYEYTPGFLHAKVVLCDEKVATVGTINFDYRSLYLHFECNVLMYKTSSLKEIKEDFESTLKLCRKIDKKSGRRFRGLYEAILRIFAPLM